MKRTFIFLIGLTALLWVPAITSAAEHGGTGVMEHGGKAAHGPSAKNIRKAIENDIKGKSKPGGVFEIMDPQINKVRRLKFLKVHNRVGKTGAYYYSCSDFKDIDSAETLDLDFDVQERMGELNIIDVRIHKVNGIERYTYDKNDNRIPVKK